MSVSFPREPLVTADLLSFMSCIEPKAIPRSILPDVGPEGQMVHASGMLCAYALVARRGNETHDIHRPVHWLLEFRGGGMGLPQRRWRGILQEYFHPTIIGIAHYGIDPVEKQQFR